MAIEAEKAAEAKHTSVSSSIKNYSDNVCVTTISFLSSASILFSRAILSRYSDMS